MPKKSNKTAHVLSLLTNGSGELSEEELPVSLSLTIDGKTETQPALISEPSKPEVIVELQGSTQPDSLSDLVKSDLEKELNNQLIKKYNNPPMDVTPTDGDERPPYSPTFLSKFGIKHTPQNEVIEENLPLVSFGQVASQPYVLEDFNDENYEKEPNSMEHLNIEQPLNDMVVTCSMTNQTTKVLHNLAEDIVKSKAPEIMRTFNMCTCQDCINDVVALTLNHTKPLYTVTEKGELFKKISSCELQCGTDFISSITKACVQVKINPRHSKIK